jgi:hypothetical protein
LEALAGADLAVDFAEDLAEGFAAAFLAGAAAFFEPFGAAEAPGLRTNRVETTSATRQGNRNFGVIEPSSLKNQAEVAGGARVSTRGRRRGRVKRLICYGRGDVRATTGVAAALFAPPCGAKLEVLKSHAEAFPSKPF